MTMNSRVPSISTSKSIEPSTLSTSSPEVCKDGAEQGDDASQGDGKHIQPLGASSSDHLQKIRMSMSTFNLYNLSRLTLPAYKTRTFFQQKWKAKSLLRQYHGEQVREGQWTRMFSRRLRSVVPMDPAYLAKNDGSAESAGRGRGLEVLEERAKKGTRMARDTKKEVELTPFMNMTFAPLERRLDVAVFRALFASSARQARQFVVHGDVKVNGQVVR